MALPQSQQKAQPIVFWVIWAAILSGLYIIKNFAAPERAEAPVEAVQDFGLFTIIGVVAAVISMGIRWLILPRVKTLESKLPMMIMGIALAEGIGIIGIFVVQNPKESDLLFSLSTACLILSAPIYVKLTGRNQDAYIDRS